MSRHSRWIHVAVAVVALAAGFGQAHALPADTTAAAHEPVHVVTDASGSRLQVGGRDFLVRGVNWDYIPIGQNFTFDLWQQPEPVIVEALDREMSLIAGMGANTLRVYAGIPPRWVRYLHERYGIYCIINHPVARYGFSLDGVWHPSVDYSDPRMRAAIAADVASALAPYRGVPGVLMYLLGNENNYGLSWSSFEIEALPKGERDAARARHLYSLFGQIIRQTKAADPDVPVAICNGDAQYIDLIAAECKGLDVFGSNVYRGISARDLFAVVHAKLGVPLLFTEFGCDAFNARTHLEDQAMQARYLIGQWREIFEQSAGHGREGNAIGGCVFQWSDGWWKHGQDVRMDIHDTNASWPDGGFEEDYVKGDNNMNEEWWGLCAKGRPDGKWLYDLYPRTGYYALRRAFAFDPYAAGNDDSALARHFADLTPASAEADRHRSTAYRDPDATQHVRVSGVRMQFEEFSTGGDLVTTPPKANEQKELPAFKGNDRLQSFYVDLEAHPLNSMTGTVSVNALKEIPLNPIDQIFYENSPQRQNRRVQVYQAKLSWDQPLFQLDGFYRTGHYHWGYEGDFFGLYREANYGPNIDVYDAAAPSGVEVAGKKALDGLKLAYGSQLWWGANPAFMLKYRRQISRFDATLVQQSDIKRQQAVATSSAISLRPTNKTTLSFKTAQGTLQIEAGGIWAGANRRGNPFQVVVREGNALKVKADHILASDAFGGKLKVATQAGRLQWYAETAAMGLVADAGPTLTTTLTGWYLKDTGSGNQRNFLTGFTYNRGHLQIAPNFLWQKPIVGPVPFDAPAPARLRNTNDDPFAVRGNRDMRAAELLLTYDPTPGSWLFAWDNDVREESRLAGSIDFMYRHMPTSMDAFLGFLADGVTVIDFQRSTPPRDLWEVNGRIVSRVSNTMRVVVHGYVGTGEPNADDQRRILRSGGDLKVTGGPAQFIASAKFNDWGPYDYHRDFNLTFPVQLMADLSRGLGLAGWFDSPLTRIGVRATWRSLDQYSRPRYTGLAGDPNGNEWEIRSYLRLAM